MKLLEVGEGREMNMVLSEIIRFGEVGVVMKDGDVRRGSTISGSNFFAPFGNACIRKPHLLEEVFLAAVQPL